MKRGQLSRKRKSDKKKSRKEEYKSSFNIIRRHNPLSSKKAQRIEAQNNLIHRWEVVVQQLYYLHAKADRLLQKRTPIMCKRAAVKKSTTLKSDPCWVHGGSDAASGMPDILSFYP